ncbi:ribonuclease J [Merdimmobilis hominis]|uniref:Ribonuclease J n=1 Tax=uncultured Anaerotruncus sp. TaxID=905011 RepID=A0A6N2QYP3_9FIRM|nr:ribonuclease J [Merdimmobilis hominis]
MPEELKQTDISEKAPAKPRSNSRRRKPKAEAGKEKKAAIPKEGTSEAPLELSAEPARKKSSRGGKKSAGRENRKPPVRIIPLGGLNEIGKNMTLYECGNDILIVDCGISFPDDEMLGVDLVIPDFSYVEKNRDRIRGLVVTHGHEDHIGAIPYLLKMVDIPVYATKLTACLIEGKLKEHGLLGRAKLNIVEAGDTVKLGCMSVEFIHVNHSIPDACGMAITTPAGVIVYTGDFKVDYTPIDGGMINLSRFGELGSKGVLAMLSDSTNAERPGTTASERTVGASFDTLFKKSGNRRVIIATFASNVHRVQQVVDAAVKYGRKVAVSGRSMVNVVAKATEIGYLKIPEGVLIDIELINRYPDNQLVIITTGSQGEPMSALTRMALGDHRKVSVTPNDYIIISASPIPGNEKGIFRVINELMKLGAEVVYEKMYNIHVSGHACQDELKLMLGLVKPKYFIPFHGEFRHLKKHADMAISMGVPAENVFITDIGRVLETDGVDMKFTGIVPAGRVLVDGLGVGDVGSIVLRDRKHLAQDGLMVVVTTIDSATGEVIAGPDIVSRGFVYVREAEEMMAEAKRVCQKALEECRYGNVREWGAMKQAIKDQLGQYLFSKTKRNPMILPVIQEV